MRPCRSGSGAHVSGVGQLVTSGPLLLALPVAAAAGAVTFLSPCCLPLVPGFLSYITGMTGTGIASPPEAGSAFVSPEGASGAAAAAIGTGGTTTALATAAP